MLPDDFQQVLLLNFFQEQHSINEAATRRHSKNTGGHIFYHHSSCNLQAHCSAKSSLGKLLIFLTFRERDLMAPMTVPEIFQISFVCMILRQWEETVLDIDV